MNNCRFVSVDSCFALRPPFWDLNNAVLFRHAMPDRDHSDAIRVHRLRNFQIVPSHKTNAEVVDLKTQRAHDIHFGCDGQQLVIFETL